MVLEAGKPKSTVAPASGYLTICHHNMAKGTTWQDKAGMVAWVSFSSYKASNAIVAALPS